MTQLTFALANFDPRPTVRRSDPSSSVIAAIERAESGLAALESETVLACLRENNGFTSAELAMATEEVGADKFDQSPDAWRSTVARRLPGLEDRGLVEAVAPSFKVCRHRRRVDPTMEPCRVSRSSAGNPIRSLRWFAKEIA